MGVLGGTGGSNSIFDQLGSTVVPPLGTTPESDFQVVSDGLTSTTLRLGVVEQVSVHLSDEGVVVTLSNNLLFGPASAAINEGATAVLDRLAGLLGRLENEVRVEGHTDDIPPTNSEAFASNWELSTARATAVLRYVQDAGGLAPSRLHAAGYAEFQPVADNGTPGGRAQNRRADVVIVYTPAEAAALESPVADLFGGE